MINPSTAPTSPNPMPAGLGALTQMSPTPRGKSPSNMGQIMAMARKMSDAQLADVLQGKSLDVPQFAAMTEAMGRKSLRNAVQGMEAKGQAQQPSLKDKLLAEESAQQMPTIPGMEPQTVMAAGGGLTSIPAPNMESMDMASGGIIAFDDGGEVPRFNGSQGSTPQLEIPKTAEERLRLEKELIEKLHKQRVPTSPAAQQVYATGKTPAPLNNGTRIMTDLAKSSGTADFARKQAGVPKNLATGLGPFGVVGLGGAVLSGINANYLNRLSSDQLSQLSESGGGSDAGLAAAILNAAEMEKNKPAVVAEKNNQNLNAEAAELNAALQNSPSLAPKPISKEQAQQQAQQRQQLSSNANPRASVTSSAGVNPSAGTLGGVEDEMAKYTDKYSKMFPEAEPFAKRDNPFSAVKYEGDSAEKTREQGLGAGLMMAASGLLKNPTFAGGLGDAMTALGNQGWATAKEVKAAKKEEREFNKEMAKASELFEQGQEDKAYKYATLAQGRQEKIATMALGTIKAKTDLFSAQSDDRYKTGLLALRASQGSGGGGSTLGQDRLTQNEQKFIAGEAFKALKGKLEDPTFKRKYNQMTPEEQNDIHQQLYNTSVNMFTGNFKMPNSGFTIDPNAINKEIASRTK
jgi:hypothetical protein